MAITLGNENIPFKIIEGKRIGVLAHPASLDSNGNHILDKLKGMKVNIATIFGPEHGFKGFAQDMEGVNNDVTDDGISIFSLYGNTLESLTPTEKMLSEIDTLIVDLQDIGSRYYTYAWTAVLCIRACAKYNKEIIICDRPNPLGGVTIEGNGIEIGFESFVGLHSVSVRHGMTIGEIAEYVNKTEELNANLTVIPMKGWKRKQLWKETELNWTNPSPNMRSFEAALLYPGMCLLEATNMSEGRGTPAPFEITGAPYVNSTELIEALKKHGLEGVTIDSIAFKPLSNKWENETCQGIRWRITDSEKLEPYSLGLIYIYTLYHLYRDKGFSWRDAPYEFVTDKPAIDLLTGSDYFRNNIEMITHDEIQKLCKPSDEFLKTRNKFLLY
ncbi:MAG: DUF1343 domain-containing protein [Pseudomonadota bacterium]